MLFVPRDTQYIYITYTIYTHYIHIVYTHIYIYVYYIYTYIYESLSCLPCLSCLSYTICSLFSCRGSALQLAPRALNLWLYPVYGSHSLTTFIDLRCSALRCAFHVSNEGKIITTMITMFLVPLGGRKERFQQSASTHSAAEEKETLNIKLWEKL